MLFGQTVNNNVRFVLSLPFDFSSFFTKKEWQSWRRQTTHIVIIICHVCPILSAWAGSLACAAVDVAVAVAVKVLPKMCRHIKYHSTFFRCVHHSSTSLTWVWLVMCSNAQRWKPFSSKIIVFTLFSTSAIVTCLKPFAFVSHLLTARHHRYRRHHHHQCRHHHCHHISSKFVLWSCRNGGKSFNKRGGWQGS